MTEIFCTLYAVTLFYLFLRDRVKIYVYLLALQGVLLFGISFFELMSIHILPFSLILTETIGVKAVGIPYLLRHIRKRNNMERISEGTLPAFYMVMITTAGLFFSFVVSFHYLKSLVFKSLIFAISIESMIAGICFIILHRHIFSHLIGYLIIENGIFLLSLAVGSEMPMLVNTAILLDIFVGVLVLGLFFNKVGDQFENIHVDQLSHLKD